MKYFLIFTFSIVFTIANFSQEYWLRKQSPVQSNLTKIIFIDTLNGWAAGDSGKIINTSNGGLNWVIQNSGIANYVIDDIFFLNKRLGWGIANDFYFFGTKMLKTTNGGQNWELTTFPDTSKVLNTIYFTDSLTGFLSGYTGEIFKTTNGGLNWEQTRIDSNFCPPLYLFPKNSFDFLNAQTGFVCGGHLDIQGIIWRTTDGGLNWLTYCTTSEPLERIKSLSTTKTIATGGDYEYGPITSTSLDAGKTWVYDTIGGFGIGSALAFRTSTELWIPLDFGRKWAISLDTGSFIAPWYFINAPDTATIKDAVFASPYFGWACGLDGTLLKYNPAVIGLPIINSSPVISTLYQNYPNPFNPVTNIKFYLARKASVIITIYDLAGREVMKYNKGVLSPGTYNISFSGNNLASGVYIYQLVTDDLVEAKKMVILK